MGETVIVRHKRERNFTVLSNVPLRDRHLSWKAKGLLAYLLSLSEAYQLRVAGLVERATDGKDSTRAGLTELQALGYLRILRERGSRGRFKSVTWIVSETPERPQAGTEQPQPDFPVVAADHKRETRLPVSPPSTTEEPVVQRTTTTTVDASQHLSFPSQLTNGERVVVVNLMKNLNQALAQALLDELQGAISAGKIKTSRVAYLQAMTRRAEIGTFVPAVGLAVADKRQREAVLVRERAVAAAAPERRIDVAVAQANIKEILRTLRGSA